MGVDNGVQPDTRRVIPDHILKLIGGQFVNGLSVSEIATRAGMRRDTIENVLRSQMQQLIRLIPAEFFGEIPTDPQ